MTRKPRNRIAWAGAWSRGHNNARYAELLPRLENVDRYYVDMHPWWPVRGFRRRIWLPLRLIGLGIRYPLVLCTDWRQIKLFRSRVVCDHDDPLFGGEEIRALNSPQVAAVVVTSESVKKKLLDLGLVNPVRVIPQGVAGRPVSRERIRAIRTEGRSAGREVVAGFHQPHLEFSAELPDGTAQQMYAVDLLFEAMERARAKDPRLVLWLVGEPSRRVQKYAEGNPWVRLLGYKARSELLDYVAAFDIGLYPRNLNLMGRTSIKVLEYMACGVPVVGFTVEEMDPVREGNAGILARDIPSFASALEALASDGTLRRRMGDNGRAAARPYEWESLASEYRALLDRTCDSKDADV